MAKTTSGKGSTFTPPPGFEFLAHRTIPVPPGFTIGNNHIPIPAAFKKLLADEAASSKKAKDIFLGTTGLQGTPAPTGDASVIDPSKIKFNLPPHNSSLPIDPYYLNSKNTKTTTDHGLRRAKLWFAYDATTPLSSGLGIQTNNTTATGTSPTTSSYVLTASQNYWGFQFLWNPTDIQIAVSRNQNFTPSSTDVLAGLAGLFTAMETIQFTIVIDRINDFAAAAAVSSSLSKPAALNSADYKNGGFIGDIKSQDPQTMLQDLLKKGTLHDLEYLFRAINGSGNGAAANKTWHNALNRETADIGFLSPNAIALQLGPDATNNLSYVGWIDSLAIKHSVFNKDMIPLHTEVQVNFNAFSKVSLTSTGG